MKKSIELPAPSITDGLLVFVQEVMAAMTTDPWLNVYCLSSNSNDTDGFKLASSIPNPLKPTLEMQTKLIAHHIMIL